MNLDTQAFVQGNGYCFQLTEGKGSPIAYVRFTHLTQREAQSSLDTLNSSDEISMVASVWEEA